MPTDLPWAFLIILKNFSIRQNSTNLSTPTDYNKNIATPFIIPSPPSGGTFFIRIFPKNPLPITIHIHAFIKKDGRSSAVFFRLLKFIGYACAQVASCVQAFIPAAMRRRERASETVMTLSPSQSYCQIASASL